MDLKTLLMAILFFGCLIGIYVWAYLMNKKTPKPEGCENLRPDCESCHDFSCPNHKKPQNDE